MLKRACCSYCGGLISPQLLALVCLTQVGVAHKAAKDVHGSFDYRMISKRIKDAALRLIFTLPVFRISILCCGPRESVVNIHPRRGDRNHSRLKPTPQGQTSVMQRTCCFLLELARLSVSSWSKALTLLLPCARARVAILSCWPCLSSSSCSIFSSRQLFPLFTSGSCIRAKIVIVESYEPSNMTSSVSWYRKESRYRNQSRFSMKYARV